MTPRDGRGRILRRLAGWGRRYAPLELFATLTALAGASIAALTTTNAVAIAYAGAWCENVGYYGYAFAREVGAIGRANAGGASDGGRASWLLRVLQAAKALLWEFGVAEVLDSFLVRPLSMYVAVRLTGSLGPGIVIGKLIADVVFYGIAIFFYELGKRRAAGRA